MPRKLYWLVISTPPVTTTCADAGSATHATRAAAPSRHAPQRRATRFNDIYCPPIDEVAAPRRRTRMSTTTTRTRDAQRVRRPPPPGGEERTGGRQRYDALVTIDFHARFARAIPSSVLIGGHPRVTRAFVA